MSLHDHMLRQFRSLLLSSGLLLSVLLAGGQAQVTTTIRPDNTLSTAVTKRGTVYDITGGTRPGNGPNLFHSFDRFSVGTNDTAHFSGPTGIVNILSRVTGGQQSVIDGRLQSTIPGANLYLLNPSGVLFGPNASLDISGSFHVSTADFLRFADGATFSAHLSEKTTLTTAPPVAFGFLSAQPAPIALQGSTLQVPGEKALSVVGGDVQIVGGQLVAPGGRLQIASVASPGEVMFSPVELAPDLQVDSFMRLGRLELSQGGLLDVSGNRGGTVLIRSGRLLVDHAQIFANTLGDMNGASLGLDLRITADAVMANGALLTTDSMGAGRGGDVRLMASSVTLDDAVIASRPNASGAGGNVGLHVGNLMLTGGAKIDSSSFGCGRGGDLTVVATEAISLTGRGSELPQTGLFSVTDGNGDAGRLFVSVPLLESVGGRILTRTLGDGKAGDLEVQGGRLTLTEGGQIFSGTGNGLMGTGGPGRGGNLTVVATEAVSIAGADSHGFQSGLFSSAQVGRGNAGNLALSTPTLTMMDGGQIAADTARTSTGNAGNLEVRVGRLTLTGGAQISTSTSGSGRGGNVAVTAAEQIELSTGGAISASSSSQGDAGNIVVQAGQIFRSRNGAVTTEAETADGGNITLMAGSRVELHDSQITATVKSGVGKGGNITIDPQFVVMQGSQVRADAFGGPGGNVRIVAGVFLADPESQVSASSALGIAGTVDIRAPITSISGAVAPLPQAFAPVAELLRDRCAGRLRQGRVSHLLLGGRDGVPSEPGSLLSSPPVQTGSRDNEEQAGTPARTGQVSERVWHAKVGDLAGLEAGCARWTG